VPYKVLLTRDAVSDLEKLDTWIATHDSPERADYVLDGIGEAFQKLTELPERGTHPKELFALGVREFREVFFKPYRIIYRVERRTVYIYLIADGGRDMQTLLSLRLLIN